MHSDLSRRVGASVRSFNSCETARMERSTARAGSWWSSFGSRGGRCCPISPEAFLRVPASPFEHGQSRGRSAVVQPGAKCDKRAPRESEFVGRFWLISGGARTRHGSGRMERIGTSCDYSGERDGIRAAPSIERASLYLRISHPEVCIRVGDALSVQTRAHGCGASLVPHASCACAPPAPFAAGPTTRAACCPPDDCDSACCRVEHRHRRCRGR